MKRKVIILAVMLCGGFSAGAQQYMGNPGLIHVPTAEMDAPATARIGAHYLNKEFLPFDRSSVNYAMGFTPYRWLSLTYAASIRKYGGSESHPKSFINEDRRISVKIQPLREGKWYPAVAVGTDDPSTTTKGQGNRFFSNFYIAASKHVRIVRGELGMHIAARYYRNSASPWKGVVGGLAYRPGFAPNLRFIAEYSGAEINAGADCLFGKHVLVQVSTQGGKHFECGICYLIDLN